jgi:hypothetical protein
MFRRTQGLLVTVLLAVAAVAFGYFIYKELFTKEKSDDTTVVVYVVVLSTCCGLAIYVGQGVSTACQRCGLMWGYQITSEFIGSKAGSTTITRKDRVYGGDNLFQTGIPDKVIVREETVPTVKNYYNNHCKCKSCGHEYSYVNYEEQVDN